MKVNFIAFSILSVLAAAATAKPTAATGPSKVAPPSRSYRQLPSQIPLNHAASKISVTMTPYGSGAPMSFLITSFKIAFEQTLNIGSQSSGAGAGKVQFAPIVITKMVDDASAPLFEMECSGTPFQSVVLTMGAFTLTLKLAAIKQDSFSIDTDGSLLETVTLEFGSVAVSNGRTAGGWDSVKNAKLLPGSNVDLRNKRL